MGCSASRLDTLIAKAIEDPSSSSSSSLSLSSNNSSLYTSSSTYSSKSMPKKVGSSSSPSSVMPKTRSLSAPMVHHPALKKGDTHHLVCLTSSTYGSLVVVADNNNGNNDGDISGKCGFFVEDGDSSPDSVINTWELMEGLEQDEQSNDFKPNKSVALCDSSKVKSSIFCDFNDAQKVFSSKLESNLNDFDAKSLTLCGFEDVQRKPGSRLGLNLGDSMVKLSDSYVFVEVPSEIVEEEDVVGLNSSTKPLWKHLSEESLLSKMDPNVDNAYHRALSAKKLGYNHSGNVSRSVGSSPFVPKESAVPLVSKLASEDGSCKVSGREEDKIVLYFTSLRGIRKTYEDCCSVRMILRGFRVMVDERDISMDSSYRKELQSVLRGKAMSLPQLFVRGRHIGGADDVKLLHETGELESLLDGFPTRLDCGFVCESCGDARFVPCSNCNGSRKVFEEEEGRTRRCPDCNENGLVRCPGCFP